MWFNERLVYRDCRSPYTIIGNRCPEPAAAGQSIGPKSRARKCACLPKRDVRSIRPSKAVVRRYDNIFLSAKKRKKKAIQTFRQRYPPDDGHVRRLKTTTAPGQDWKYLNTVPRVSAYVYVCECVRVCVCVNLWACTSVGGCMRQCICQSRILLCIRSPWRRRPVVVFRQINNFCQAPLHTYTHINIHAHS